ncbi:hypothetical protein SynNOUM97013_00707 [Synechococcus sp. NOUM97013]|nr:hypothetical protein SynNOUM97013_00707 [Synechococcus sp. NOUM97013]
MPLTIHAVAASDKLAPAWAEPCSSMGDAGNRAFIVDLIDASLIDHLAEC